MYACVCERDRDHEIMRSWWKEFPSSSALWRRQGFASNPAIVSFRFPNLAARSELHEVCKSGDSLWVVLRATGLARCVSTVLLDSWCSIPSFSRCGHLPKQYEEIIRDCFENLPVEHGPEGVCLWNKLDEPNFWW